MSITYCAPAILADGGAQAFARKGEKPHFAAAAAGNMRVSTGHAGRAVRRGPRVAARPAWKAVQRFLCRATMTCDLFRAARGQTGANKQIKIILSYTHGVFRLAETAFGVNEIRPAARIIHDFLRALWQNWHPKNLS